MRHCPQLLDFRLLSRIEGLTKARQSSKACTASIATSCHGSRVAQCHRRGAGDIPLAHSGGPPEYDSAMVTGRLSGSVLTSASDAGMCSGLNGDILARDNKLQLKSHHTAAGDAPIMRAISYQLSRQDCVSILSQL